MEESFSMKQFFPVGLCGGVGGWVCDLGNQNLLLVLTVLYMSGWGFTSL